MSLLPRTLRRVVVIGASRSAGEGGDGPVGHSRSGDSGHHCCAAALAIFADRSPNNIARMACAA